MATGEVTQDFKSPKWALARCFRLSRDRWKQKYMGLQKAHKTLKVRVSDMEKSRSRWREEAESRTAELERMVEELDGLRAQVQEHPEPQVKNRPLLRVAR